jgi:hypothetical protein
LTKIAAQPDKSFGEMVRQRRRKRGLPVSPIGKVLPFQPAWRNDHSVEEAAVDSAAEIVFAGNGPPDDLLRARVRLAERRRREALLALEDTGLHGLSADEVARLEQIYASELAAYTALMSPAHGASFNR